MLLLLRTLPSVVCESPVGLRHFIGVFALFDGAAGVVHASMSSPARRSRMVFSPRLRHNSQPAQSEGLPPFGADFDRHLVGAPPTRRLDSRLGMMLLTASLKASSGSGRTFPLRCRRRRKRPSGLRPSAVQHDAVNELRHEDAVIHGVRQYFSLGTLPLLGTVLPPSL
jgi:hypothetical protein